MILCSTLNTVAIFQKNLPIPTWFMNYRKGDSRDIYIIHQTPKIKQQISDVDYSYLLQNIFPYDHSGKRYCVRVQFNNLTCRISSNESDSTLNPLITTSFKTMTTVSEHTVGTLDAPSKRILRGVCSEIPSEIRNLVSLKSVLVQQPQSFIHRSGQLVSVPIKVQQNQSKVIICNTPEVNHFLYYMTPFLRKQGSNF